jgi:tripartite-type tricarboxylate transporter receptor subunit TctC
MKTLLLVIMSFFAFSLISTSHAEPLRIVTSSTPGGSFDVNARLVARHLSKHLPDKRNVVVVNMPGAGGIIALNWFNNIADQNNTLATISVNSNAILNGILKTDANVKYDISKFHFLFSNEDGENGAQVLWSNSGRGLKSIDQMLVENTFVIGSQTSGEINFQELMLKDILGVKSKYIVGYSNVVQAFLINEIDARVATLNSAKIGFPAWLQPNNQIGPILVLRKTRHPELQNVPAIQEYVKNEFHLQVLDFYYKMSKLSRVFIAPPGMNSENVEMFLRAAVELEKDKEFLQDAAKLNLFVDFIHKQEIDDLVKSLVNTDDKILKYIQKK